MDLKGEYRIAAPREHVWALINDPTVLAACIPGCEGLEGTPEKGFTARVTTKIGPVKATFAGEVTLSNINAPESLTISGEGKGGVAGFAKGGADVHLAEDGSDTVLTYLAKAQVGGKLAQLGARLIDSTAKKLADEFFEKLAGKAAVPNSEAAAGSAEATGATNVLDQGSFRTTHESPAPQHRSLDTLTEKPAQPTYRWYYAAGLLAAALVVVGALVV